MKHPEFLEKYADEACHLVKAGAVKGVEFSRNTYVIQIQNDANDEACVFFQLNAADELQDSFCSCSEQDDQDACMHLAVAWEYVFSEKDVSLSRRFEASFWKALALVAIDHSSYEVNIEHFSEECGYCPSSNKIRLEAKNEEGQTFLRKILLDRERETEETSIKFSGLSENELNYWREGRPSPELMFELSFWADLCKWFLVKSEQGTQYKIEFNVPKDGLPDSVLISGELLQVELSLSSDNLLRLIPTLSTVSSNLNLLESRVGEIDKVIFDQGLQQLVIHGTHEKLSGLDAEGIFLGDWLYIPEKGFSYNESCSWWEQGTFRFHEVPEVLNRYHTEISPVLEGHQICAEAKRIDYKPSFDEKWNLHLGGSLLSENDLAEEGVLYFEDWIFLPRFGFQKIQGECFEENVITTDKANEFIAQNRIWLSHFSSYKSHLTSLDSKMTFILDSSGTLHFDSSVDLRGYPKAHDFGSWVYVAGQGFFGKSSQRGAGAVRAGVKVESDEISSFIQENRDDLESVEGFFAKKSPISNASLEVRMKGKKTILVSPHYELREGFSGKLRFFSDYLFVTGEGFSLVPLLSYLPSQWCSPRLYKGKEIREFFEQDYPRIQKYVSHIDIGLRTLDKFGFHARNMEEPDAISGVCKIHLELASEWGEVRVTDLWRALQRGYDFSFTEAGCIDLNDDRFRWLRQLPSTQVDLDTGYITLKPIQLVRLDALFGIGRPLGSEDYEQKTRHILHNLMSLQCPENPDLSLLKSQLRAYQASGVNWLWFLYCNHLSGLLCDDMGLGKTHQSMALMAGITAEHRANTSLKNAKFLVVCPTSVIYHWEDKLRRFLPDLKVLVYHGSKRDLSLFDQHDLLLTSYGVSRIDVDDIKKQAFDLVVYDEIQVAKNHRSQLHETLKEISGRMVLGLSGTPIENQLLDLKSLFDIVLPEYMPGIKQFKQNVLFSLLKMSRTKKQSSF